MDDLDTPLTIPAALRRAAERFSTRPAYVEGGAGGRRSVTWGELHRLVEDTAAGIIALGLNRGDRVAVCAENSIDWLCAYLGTVTAGGAGVLVYHDLKPGEISDQVGRPESRFLVASTSVLQKLGADAPKVERIIEITSGKDAGSAGALPFASVTLRATAESREALANRRPSADDLAALIYTSGTTGGAKGVMLSHRNLLSNAESVQEAFGFTQEDSVLLVLPLHHAMPFMVTVVLPSLVGARVTIENDLRRVRDRMREAHPTVFFGVPALFDLMYRNVLARAESDGRLPQMQAWLARAAKIKRLTGLNIGPLIFRPVHRALGGKLRFLMCGGAAALSPATAQAFFGLGLPLLQGWGMTEASPVVAVQRFSASKFRYTRYYEKQLGSVGPALPSVEVRLIDVPEKGMRVAVDGQGEVIVRGPNVFQGYWEAPEATAAAKLDGWLRTGDVGRIDRAGNIYLTGRSKYIIVLDSGEKVYPDELEDKLATSSLIGDVVVLGRQARDKIQVSAIVYPALETVQQRLASNGLAVDEASVRKLLGGEVERLGRELAAYKRIASVELSDTPLPKTPLRKVARGQLLDSYSFDVERWLASADEAVAAS